MFEKLKKELMVGNLKVVKELVTKFLGEGISAKDILDNKVNAKDRYLDFLKSGRSEFPIETLKKAGTDLSTNEPTIRSLEWMDQLLDMLEEML